MVLTRVTDGEDERLRHQYSRRQAWNADESLLYLGETLLDAQTLEPVVERVPLSSASVWSNTDPNALYGIRYDPDPNVFGRYDVVTGTYTPIRRLSRFEQCRIGDGEGSLSNDDSRIVLVCSEGGEGSKTLVSLDTSDGSILGTLDAMPDFNWASFSQSGRYIVVENNEPGGDVRELWRYSPDFSEGELLTEEVEHGDLGLLDDGGDVYVMVDWHGFDVIRLDDGQRFELSFGRSGRSAHYGHVSCRNIGRPGWCYVSTRGNRAVGAIRLAIGPPGAADRAFPDRSASVVEEFELWGYHRSTSADYASEAQASVSPSGRRVIFTSDWEGSSVPSEYVLELADPGPTSSTGR